MASPRPTTKGINAGSMADIAFLLLIFFLVTTTMYTETGMLRKLPPPVDAAGTVSERNVLEVWINASDQLMVGGTLTDVSDLPELAATFISNPKNLPHLPEKRAEHIEGLGTVAVSRQVISLQSDLHTSYGTYVAVQDALEAAYLRVRNEFSRRHFNRSYTDLLESGNAAAVSVIRAAYPMRISEAEPMQASINQSQ